MADLNATYDRRSIRRVSQVLSQIQPCSPSGDTSRHNGRPGDTSTPLRGTKRPPSQEEDSGLLEFLDYYREGKEFYDQLLCRVDSCLSSTTDYVTRIYYIVNNNNLNIQKVPDKYKQVLSLLPPVTPEDTSLLRTQFHSRVQSEVAHKRGLLSISKGLTDLRKQLTDLTRYIDAINRTLGAREEDALSLFLRLREQYRTGTNL